jgi:hypothetical protein
MESRKLLLALILLIVLALSMIVWFYPPTGDFRTDNPFWNGLSSLSEQTEVTTLSSLSNLPSPSKGTSLLIVPYEQFTESDLSAIKNYVTSGGTLVLLDDYGFGNQVLTSLGSDMRFNGQPLIDPLFDYHSKYLPKITDFTSTPLSANVSSIVFNHPTALSGTSSATVVAQSSSFSFLDSNQDGTWDPDELNGPFPVVAYAKISQGYVVAVADPSFLINGMLSLDDNLQFYHNIVSVQATNPQVYVDQSHLPHSLLDDGKAILNPIYSVVASPLGTLSLIVVALAISLKPMWERRGKHDEK